jgi:hypothetical protein
MQEVLRYIFNHPISQMDNRNVFTAQREQLIFYGYVVNNNSDRREVVMASLRLGILHHSYNAANSLNLTNHIWRHSRDSPTLLHNVSNDTAIQRMQASPPLSR